MRTYVTTFQARRSKVKGVREFNYTVHSEPVTKQWRPVYSLIQLHAELLLRHSLCCFVAYSFVTCSQNSALDWSSSNNALHPTLTTWNIVLLKTGVASPKTLGETLSLSCSTACVWVCIYRCECCANGSHCDCKSCYSWTTALNVLWMQIYYSGHSFSSVSLKVCISESLLWILLTLVRFLSNE